MASYKPPVDPRGSHARLYWDLLDSNAWRCLSATDQRAYIALQRQLKSFNNGDLSLPLSFARNHGIKSPATLAKSLRALGAVGLIAVTRKGGCTKGGQRLPTLYRFTDHEAYEVPAKHLDAHKPSYEWRNVKTLAQGRHLIREAEAKAAEKEALKKKSLLQSLTVTASNNEAVGALTASNNEAWPTVPLQKLNHGKVLGNSRKANNDGASGNSDDISDSENHTSNTEVLSTCYQVGGVSGGAATAGQGQKRTVGRPDRSSGAKTRRPTQMNRIVGKPGRSGTPKGATKATTPAKADHPPRSIRAMSYASLRVADVGRGVAWATR